MIAKNKKWFSIFMLSALCAVLLNITDSYAVDTPAPQISSAQQMKNWTADIDKIDKELHSDQPIDSGMHNAWQESLIKIRQGANKLAEERKSAIHSEKSVLSALGDAPENSNQEAASIRKQRSELENKIAKIDAELKRAKFTIARADEIHSMIEQRAKAQSRSKLFSRSFMLLSTDAWQQIGEQASTLASTLTTDYSTLFLLLGLAVIIGLSFPVTRYLNHFFDKAPHIKLIHKFRRKRLLLMAIAMYVVFLLRIGIFNLDALLALEDALQALASICLALVLFSALGRFEFVDTSHHADALGETKRSYHGMLNGIRKLVRFVLILVPIASLAGYVNLTLYLSFNVALTFTAILLFMWMRSLAVNISCMLSPQCKLPKEELSPLAISIIEPVLALFSLSLILFFWGLTTEDITGWFSEFQGGIQLGDITIDIVSIGTAISLFATLWITTKTLQWFLSSRVFQYTKLDSGIRDAILAVTGYIGTILAILVALGAVGIDMSNLAIVAGALSVGIGFGLQAIFNNFVSGLILLFERPVKVGDWVIVGENHGIIKKIRVRSTEIETFLNSSVIVPNSQLISETVTNWTLHDKAGRVDVAVGVAYGSDTEKVKEVLLGVAKEHPQVRAYPATKVIFTEFGDSSLNFELRCFINNIRDIYTVSSELRFAVDRAFREHNIEIPFPQRDLHIKSAEPLTVNQGAQMSKQDE